MSSQTKLEARIDNLTKLMKAENKLPNKNNLYIADLKLSIQQCLTRLSYLEQNVKGFEIVKP